MSTGVFVQVGATRDGIDPYLEAAHTRGLRAVLIDTPEYLQFRSHTDARRFDEEFALDRPQDAHNLVKAICGFDAQPELVLPGFERYVESTYAATRALGLRPGVDAPDFRAPYKLGQRLALREKQPSVLQPRFAGVQHLDDLPRLSHDLRPPVVIKPENGGAGLGVAIVSQVADLPAVASRLVPVRNYGGDAFSGWLLEEEVQGSELSVQGIVRRGSPNMLTFCEKVIGLEPSFDGPLMCGTRELGHSARPGWELDPRAADFVRQCIAAVGYTTGPFHIDFIRTDHGLYFLEMGFRLSGMMVAQLVDHVSGSTWADEAMRAHLGEPEGVRRGSAEPQQYMGALVLRTEAQSQFARRLQAQLTNAKVLVATKPAPEVFMSGAPKNLASDLARHSDSLGRLTVTASSSSLVWHVLKCCQSATL